jgi:hypothetical protein
MFSKSTDNAAAWMFFIGAPLATVFLMMSNVTDPVNAPKLFIVGGLAFSVFSILIFFNMREAIREYKLFLIFVLFFLLSAFNAVINSSLPLAQNIYGSFGRNTGLVAYLALSLIALGALNLRDLKSFHKVIMGLQFAGIINVIYCAWVLSFGDFLSWNNPYGKILGLFGNPDFISAFLGIFITSLIATAAAPSATTRYRILSTGISFLAFFEVIRSHAIQGIVVTLGGLSFVGFFLIRSKFKSNLVHVGYVGVISGVGILGILGTLQKGPFSFIYKTSVSLRGAYWDAGLSMGLNNPLTGVGMDGYGDWYRRARSLDAATVLPGPKTVTNASHNVVIDFFAYGGYPLLLGYLGIMTITLVAIFRVIRRSRTFEPIFVAMVSAWACYQVQSLISINQVGLAIWGWLLAGSLVAYESATRGSQETTGKSNLINTKSRPMPSTSVFSPQLVAGLGAVLGLIISVPPLSADMKWRSALNSQNATAALTALESGYLTPSDSQRMAQAVQLFVTNSLPNQAYEVAKKAVEFNPDYFDAWKQLYFLPNATLEDKSLAVINMKRLDPFNPDVTAQ